jgi:type I restriction enzyme S subunit
LRLQNIGDGVFRDERAYISLDHFETLAQHEVRGGDLILASLGVNLPRVALVPELKAPAIVKADVIRARLHECIDKKWVLYALQSPSTRAYAVDRIRGVGRPRLGLGEIRKLPIPLPPLAEQRRIVKRLEDYLSRLDEASGLVERSERRTRNSLWSSILGAVVDQALVAEATGTGRDRRQLAEVAVVQGGIQKQPKRKPVLNKYPFLRVANVPRGRLDLSEVHEVELFDGEIERFALRAGDLLVVEGNGSADQIGRASLWRGEIPNAVHQNHLIRVRPGTELLPEYLELVWNAPQVSSQVQDLAKSTSGLHTLSSAKIKSVRIPVPSLERQRQLVDDAELWRSHLEVASTEIASALTRAGSLRRKLLDEAFRGRLVPQEPADEPASALLARIYAERHASLGGSQNRSTRVIKTSIVPPGIQEELPL